MTKRHVVNQCSKIANKRPYASGLTQGEIAVNYSSEKPRLYIKNSEGKVISIAGVDYMIAASAYTKPEVDAKINDERKYADDSFVLLKTYVGLNEDFTYTPSSEDSYIASETKVAKALDTLDSSLKSLSDTVDDNEEKTENSLEALSGVISSNKEYVDNSFKTLVTTLGIGDDFNYSFSGKNTNYLENSKNVTSAIIKLDSELGVLSTKEDNDISALEDKVSLLSGNVISDEEAIVNSFSALIDTLGIGEHFDYSFSGKGTNYLENASNVTDSIIKLDSAIKNSSSDLDSQVTALTKSLGDEIDRAKNAESAMTNALNDEVARAENAESALTDSLNDEVERAKDAESALTNSINDEVARATEREDAIVEQLSHYVSSVTENYNEVTYPSYFENSDSIKKNDSFDVAFNKVETTVSALSTNVESNEKVSAAAFAKLKGSMGLTVNLDYEPSASDVYISASSSVSESLDILDENLNKEKESLLKSIEGSKLNLITEDETKAYYNGNEIAALKDIVSGVSSEYSTVTYSEYLIGAESISKNDSFDVAFNKVETSISALTYDVLGTEETITNSFDAVKISVGLDENLNYSFSGTGTNYLDSAANIVDAVNILDDTLSNTSSSISALDSKIGDNYYTKSDIDEKGYITSYTETDPVWTSEKSNYYSKDEIDSKFNNVASGVSSSYSTIEYDEYFTNAESISANDSFDVAFNKVETTISALSTNVEENESVSAAAFEQLQNSLGLSEHLEYVPSTSSTYVSAASNISEAIELLDANISSNEERTSSYSEDSDGNVQIVGNKLYWNGEEMISKNDIASMISNQYSVVGYYSDDSRVKRTYTDGIVVSGGWTSDDAVTSAEIGAMITIIGASAFSGCSSLSSVTMYDTIQMINNDAFNGCINLSDITLPSSLETLWKDVFQNCSSLKEVTIPDKVASILDYDFAYCTSLSSVTLGSKVQYIGSSAFFNCTSLSSIRFKSSTAPSIASETAFSGIPSTGTLIIPQGSDYSSWTSLDAFKNWTVVEE